MINDCRVAGWGLTSGIGGKCHWISSYCHCIRKVVAKKCHHIILGKMPPHKNVGEIRVNTSEIRGLGILRFKIFRASRYFQPKTYFFSHFAHKFKLLKTDYKIHMDEEPWTHWCILMLGIKLILIKTNMILPELSDDGGSTEE